MRFHFFLLHGVIVWQWLSIMYAVTLLVHEAHRVHKMCFFLIFFCHETCMALKSVSD